jgi:aminopeptidase N
LPKLDYIGKIKFYEVLFIMRMPFPLFPLALLWQAAHAQQSIPDLSHHFFEAQNKARQLFDRRLKVGELQANYGYDVAFYHLQLKINPASREIEGQMVMEATSETAGLMTAPLDLYANMQVLSVGESAASFTRAGNVITLTLKQQYQRGEKFRVSVSYRGQPESGGFGAFTFNTHNGAPIIASLSEPYYARLWWPCKDTPTDKADSVQIDLTVPGDLIAVSNGKLENVQADNSWKTFFWKTRYAIATYLVSVAVSNYAEFGEIFTFAGGATMPLVHYIYPERLAEAQTQLADTRDMLAFFNWAFGDYPFKKEKYGHAQFAFGGGMEHQTITSIGGFSDGLISHEMTHQWFGDLITMKSWQDIWLNEGFASYGEALFAEHRDGKAAYRNYMAHFDHTYTGSVFVRDTTSVGSIFNITVYHKGAWVLHMLRHVIGDSTFFRLLRGYAADSRYRFGNATTGDFKNLAEQISGQELDWFFEQWVYREGRPDLRYAWKSESTQLILRLQQTQQGESYRLPLELAAIAGADTFHFAFEHAGGCQEYVFPLARAVDKVLIDPENLVLKTLHPIDFPNFAEDCTISPNTFALQPVYPNPFALEQNHLTINFSLSRNENVRLAVFNVIGQEVAALLTKQLPSGVHTKTWDGRTTNGDPLRTQPAPAGIYFIRLQTETAQATRKFVILR